MIMVMMCNDILHVFSIFQCDKCKRFVLNNQRFITKSLFFLSFLSNKR
ncbi:conserved domain protein [Bacteroides clarus YIT 12056]|uniref:Conserved domain protein n=1 Tax=Bacteroides clarus YIT 12056 TaxID=762984 RepID=A0ABN0CSG8_9BACE|nr:conserved domain protein [Bacteroides clarus YIT 12056]